METITYGNIQVEGYPYLKILQVMISHEANEHGRATIVGEIQQKVGEECLKRTDENTQVMISTTAQGQVNKLFLGSVYNITLNTQAEYAILTLELIGLSSKLDTKKENRSFQSTGKSYSQILNSIVKGKAIVDITVTDQAIGAIIVQYNETNWEFIKRMASRFNAPVIASITTEKPYITVGLPTVKGSSVLETVEFNYGLDNNAYDKVSENYLSATSTGVTQQDFSALSAKSYTYKYLGDTVQLNGKTYKVKGISSKLVDGLLENTYKLAGETGFVAPIAKNVQCSGRMFRGQVKEVKRDLVKVFLVDIDSEFDGGGDWWFPYSTVYSLSDGSGWYCMPEVGDMVRVFFPSNNEEDSFAASAVNISPLDNPRDKSWKAPTGKEILLTDEGIYIICDGQKIFIDLTLSGGIRIVSSENISVSTDKNIKLEAGENITMTAGKSIVMGTPNSYIEMNDESITLSGERVLIN